MTPLQKKLRTRFAILIVGFAFVVGVGGYFLRHYFSLLFQQSEAVEANPLEASREPLLPVVNPRPMDLHAQRFVPLSPEQAAISLVLLGVGQFPDLTQQALDQLPSGITFAISPLTSNAKEWAQKARQKQHEVVVNVGLQPDNYPSNDPGPNTLLTNLSGEENIKRLHWALEQVPLAVGITHNSGSYFTTVEASLRPMVQEVRRAGLFFLDTLLSPDSFVAKISQEEKSPYAVTYYFCNENPFMIEKDLQNLEIFAKQKGHLIAVALLTPAFLQKLTQWSGELAEKNISLLPLTALFKLNTLKDTTRADVQKP